MLRPSRSLRRQLRRSLRRGVRRFRADERGAVAVIFALSLGAVAGTLALSYEIGEAWTVQTELAAAADAAALAGATQLDRENGAIVRARQIAISELARNSQTFATDGQGGDIVIPGTNVSFYATLADARAKANPLADADWAIANFIRVETGQRSVGFSFSRLVSGPDVAEPDGLAIAGTGSIYCKIPPMFFCMPSDPALLTEGNGVWMKGKDNGATSSWAPGNFGLLALNQIDGSASLSASEITDAMARVNPLAQCYSTDGTVQTKPGETTSIANGLNMRFDIYPQGTHQVPSGEVAVQGNPQYRPSVNTVKGLSRTGNKCSLKANGWEIPANPFDGPGEHADLTTSGNPVDAMGYPRDNCAYPLTGNNPATSSCAPAAGEGRFGDGEWDRDTYFRVNHPAVLGGASAADLDGDGRVTRYETFIWEIENTVSGAGSGEIPHRPPTSSTSGDELGDTINNAICHTNTTTYDPSEVDRRVLTVAVLDCAGLSGTATVTPLGYYNIFLTEPVGVFGDPPDNKSIYAEIIGPAADPGFGAKVARTTIQLYE